MQSFEVSRLQERQEMNNQIYSCKTDIPSYYVDRLRELEGKVPEIANQQEKMRQGQIKQKIQFDEMEKKRKQKEAEQAPTPEPNQ